MLDWTQPFKTSAVMIQLKICVHLCPSVDNLLDDWLAKKGLSTDEWDEHRYHEPEDDSFGFMILVKSPAVPLLLLHSIRSILMALVGFFIAPKNARVREIQIAPAVAFFAPR